MEDRALPLRDQVEEVRELLGVPEQRVVRSGDQRVLHGAVPAPDLPSRLHAHLHAGDQDVAVRDEHVRPPHHEPLASEPLLVCFLWQGEVGRALHANDWLLVLAHGKLLQVVVSLEHNLANTGAGQPTRLEALNLRELLHPVGFVHGVFIEDRSLKDDVVLRVEGEEGFSAFFPPDLQCQSQILQVDGRCRVSRALDTNGVGLLVIDKAKQPLFRHAHAHQLTCIRNAARNPVRLPADVVLGTP
mmetsp:Transcript_43244/g.134501  ORF Transcript_43244/g.134501 Transcript_43244/m.134501 type:complete len:244 (+) Transcript_43244:558-1289(+)